MKFNPLFLSAQVLVPAMLLLVATTARTQPSAFHITHSCSFNDEETDPNVYFYEPSDEATRIVNEIVDALGLTKNFSVKASNVSNALATAQGGQRYILYSTTFLEKFKGDERTRWAAYGVLAHEIGHHLNNDNFSETDMKVRKIYELEADRFSGSVLRMLGATLLQAQSGVESIELEGETKTHPGKAARREAVATGWKKRDEFIQARSADNLTDRDGDGVPDSHDQCPTEYGNHSSGCPDSDEDGIPDKDDDCDYEKGPVANHGCPTPTLSSDRDGDGVPDAGDQCPDKKGEKRYAGCPDSDGDGVPDNKDKCVNEKGLTSNGGCPGNVKSPSEAIKYSDVPTPVLPPEPFRNHKSGLTMVPVEGGTFMMGSPATERDRSDDECQHTVTVKSFFLGQYEVTQSDWLEIMGENPSYFDHKCTECPVEYFSWDDLQEFLRYLNARFPGNNYRLPTESEWEYAAKGGNIGKGYRYGGDNLIGNVAWYSGNSQANTKPVGARKPNELGIYDMSGNVWECCQQDTAQPYPCDTKAKLSVFCPVRGGSGDDTPDFCRVSNRNLNRDKETIKGRFTGLRLARD